MALHKNDKGADVVRLQQLLTAKGYKLTTDGRFGDKTFQAVLEYQRDHGLKPDGIVGPATWASLSEGGVKDTILNGVKCIICSDITPAYLQGKASTSNYENSICGTFTYPSGVNVCSILISHGATLGGYSCHYWPMQGNCPESVIYRTQEGEIGIKRCKTANELPIGTIWAIGGMGLLDNYNPTIEGFVNRYADVRRKTDHNVLAVLPSNQLVLALCENMTDVQINKWCKAIGAKYAILLDGGHLASINSNRFSKRSKTRQGVIVQGVK